MMDGKEVKSVGFFGERLAKLREYAAQNTGGAFRTAVYDIVDIGLKAIADGYRIETKVEKKM